MKELEELLKQKHEIEQRIREIRKREFVFGNAKIGVRQYSSIPDEWYLAVKVRAANYDSRPPYGQRHEYKYSPIYNGKTREEVIDKIPEIVNDLQGLWQNITAEENE